MPDITREEVEKLLSYNPETGEFRWKIKWGNQSAGNLAGNTDRLGYLTIQVHRKLIKAHRIAFLLMTGSWPKSYIDHINRNPSDNRFCNLREVTPLQNTMNRSVASNNTSGVAGVSYEERRGKWRAHIKVNGKMKSLGYFKRKEDAIAARKKGEETHFGEFSAR
ncbi:HNH endonuclease [Enterobacter hormaechei subsp. steigerwaltii]|jgi:hypothetical protein|uniref:HNH endonuclease n=1 Tax=Enterobacter hormaechei TaxID=158836 RepID=UPI0007938081|nr:HNH endonuclease [Enterobacter hormaechei]HBB6760732.1 HNH endonuclease [Citrobacter amalonaticus]ELC6297069.1 HNH endonuclease [Enterobacter hormaechei]ELC6543318.1 HNH endonuclease [Enterobacter hormaechei]MCC9378896.1 HNH endonuclease [Enterobacter hormaechei subsp. steigerwaltii]MCC9392878.1 HNH endonuclease [Enterobacter hormaechei subsp. steigerwaltii]